eukprot:9502540-Pyramimonas_sp.AAC.1
MGIAVTSHNYDKEGFYVNQAIFAAGGVSHNAHIPCDITKATAGPAGTTPSGRTWALTRRPGGEAFLLER